MFASERRFPLSYQGESITTARMTYVDCRNSWLPLDFSHTANVARWIWLRLSLIRRVYLGRKTGGVGPCYVRETFVRGFARIKQALFSCVHALRVGSSFA